MKQKPGYASYTATLVKYADLICNKPAGQAKLTLSVSAASEEDETDTDGGDETTPAETPAGTDPQ